MVVIVSALRSAIGKYGGALSNTSPENLLVKLYNKNLSEIDVQPDIIDEIIIGQTKQSAHNPNIARLSLLKAEFPIDIPAHTIHMQCGSGMQAVINGALSIISGQSEVVLAGGVEIMSQAPYYFVGNRFGIRPGNMELYDSNTESQPKSQPESLYGRFTMGLT